MFNPTIIESTIQSVSTEYEEATQERKARETAESELLATIIVKIRPVLRAVGSRLQIAFAVAHHADFNQGKQTPTFTKERYLCVAGNDSAVEDCPQANGGAYRGRGLFVREDGVLAVVRWGGDWSRWQGSCWGWEGTLSEYTDALSVVRDGWKLQTILDNIADALEATVGTRTKAINADRTRAEDVRAVSHLLDGRVIARNWPRRGKR